MTSLQERLTKVSTANIADASDHLDLECKWLSREMKVTRRDSFWGYASTVDWVYTRKTSNIKSAGPSTWDEVKGFISDLSFDHQIEKRVYVAGNKFRSDEFVLLGGMSITYIHQLGYSGIVANGLIRDYDEVSEIDLPIWFHDWGVMDSQGCMRATSIKQYTYVNGHRVEKNDLIVGDGNGVVAIPNKWIEPLLERALVVAKIENEVLSELRKGTDLIGLVENGGHI